MFHCLKKILIGACFGLMVCRVCDAVEQASDGVKNNFPVERETPYKVHPLILNRWSPRAFSQEELSDEQLMTLFDAARWAPSSYNNQSWRFVYAKRGSAAWQSFLNLLVPFNREWASSASALVIIVSKNSFDFNAAFSRTHSFDTGAAWQNLALQAVSMGLITHGMEGFDYDQAAQLIALPEGYTIEIMAAVGYQADSDVLPEYMKKDEHPSTRKSLDKLVFEGSFPS